jgi:hypothetical protein
VCTLPSCLLRIVTGVKYLVIKACSYVGQYGAQRVCIPQNVLPDTDGCRCSAWRRWACSRRGTPTTPRWSSNDRSRRLCGFACWVMAHARQSEERVEGKFIQVSQCRFAIHPSIHPPLHPSIHPCNYLFVHRIRKSTTCTTAAESTLQTRET